MSLGHEEKNRLNKQSTQVFEILRTGAWINQVDAIRWNPPVMRLASRIHEIRESGFDVQSRAKKSMACVEYRLIGTKGERLF